MPNNSSCPQWHELADRDNAARKPHAVLDLPSRLYKSLKIERLLKLYSRQRSMLMLEVGTGSGGMAHYFAMHPHLCCEVDAVDIHDNRPVTEGYNYHQVTSKQLPFCDYSYDVVISNHVIEHVGDEKQRQHLSEIRRVLRPNEVGYLALPNRRMLVEPHYRLPFLSWFPRKWRTPYLRMMGKGDTYDCEPLQMRQLEHMLIDAGFNCSNICIEVLRATFEIERPHSLGTYLFGKVPDGVLSPLRRIIPTLIYRIEPLLS